MENLKPWWASKTLWVNFVAVAASLLGAFTVDIGFDLSPEGQVAFVGTIMGLVNIALRMTTRTALVG